MELDYTYGVARIRALESSLFDDDTITALLQCQNYDECMNFLRDKGWGDGSMEQSPDEMLSEEKEKTWQVLKDLVEDCDAVDILSIKDEFHNLKAAIKQVCTTDETKDLFYTHCKLEPEYLKNCIRQGEYGSLPENMREAAKEATETLLKTGSGQLCDVIIDKATLQAIKQAGENSENGLIKKYADLQIMIADIKIAVRCAATGKDSQFAEKCLVSCQEISVAELAAAVDNGMDEVCGYLESVGFSDAVAALKKSKSVFECWCDNRMIEDIRSEKYKAFSIGPIVAYVIARENEIKTVKIILSGKLNGFDNEFIRERVRVMYA